MGVSSRRLAPVQHRHLPARGLLSLFSLLRAFLLTIIKRNQAFWVAISAPRAHSPTKKRPGGVVHDPNPTRIQETLRGKSCWGEIQNGDVGCLGRFSMSTLRRPPVRVYLFDSLLLELSFIRVSSCLLPQQNPSPYLCIGQPSERDLFWFHSMRGGMGNGHFFFDVRG